MLPEIDFDSWNRPAIFDYISDRGVDESEMRRVFNLGIGYTLVVAPENRDEVTEKLREKGETPVVFGTVA
jgi:phosphoribosylformylglycinamidine cyclo-ligase